MSNFWENSDYLRSVFLWKSFKKIIEEKNITITKIAENMNTSQPAISNVLNWKKYASDTFFTKIAKAIPLTESEIKKIFFEADKEEMKYKYGSDFIPDWKINTLEDIDFDNEELLKVMFKKEFWKELSEHDREEILKFIKYTANK